MAFSLRQLVSSLLGRTGISSRKSEKLAENLLTIHSPILASIFPAGSVGAFILAIVAAPRLGASGVGGALLYGLVLGAVLSACLFALLKFLDMRQDN